MSREKITDDIIKDAVDNSTSMYGVLRYLGLKQAGGNCSHYKRRIDKAKIDISHFTGQAHNKGKVSKTRRPPESILILRSEGRRECCKRLRRALIESGVEYICLLCGQKPEWKNNPLTLDVDHINENWLDDRIDNLRFLCPNCHSQFSRNLIG